MHEVTPAKVRYNFGTFGGVRCRSEDSLTKRGSTPDLQTFCRKRVIWSLWSLWRQHGSCTPGAPPGSPHARIRMLVHGELPREPNPQSQHDDLAHHLTAPAHAGRAG
mgnify:CR=1 FL=1